MASRSSPELFFRLFSSDLRICQVGGEQLYKASVGRPKPDREDREGGEWKRPTSTKRQQKIQSNIKLSMFLYVSLAF